MNCPSCENKGFIESHYAAGNSWTPSIQQCPKRCNISAYSNEVQRRLSPGYVTKAPVLCAKPPEKPLRQPLRLCD